MKKFKKILSILVCILLVSIYLATLIFALCDWKGAADLFKASLYMTVILPVLIYAFLLVYRYLSDLNKDRK